MARDVSIRQYRPGDADAVWAVHEAAFRASPLAFVDDADADEDIHSIESAYLENDGEFLVGAIEGPEGGDDAVVAIGGFQPLDDERIEIRRMRVDPDYQRRGYAAALLEELEGRARRDGYDVAELETVEPLEAARAFYENAGYEVVEESTHPITGVATYHYRKPL